MTTLVIFDIDGTLLETADLHHRIIIDLLAADGLDVTFQPWSAYPHYTDLGVLQAVHQHFRGRPISAEELARYDRLYAEALNAHLIADPVSEVAGAAALIRDLQALPDVALAYATGSLPGMAKIKLSLLGINAGSVALATGGEFLSREEIVKAAIHRAMGKAAPDRVVILGDGIWDQKTAENLGFAFVALETGTHKFGAGPVRVLRDFTPLSAADLVALARPPQRG